MALSWGWAESRVVLVTPGEAILGADWRGEEIVRAMVVYLVVLVGSREEVGVECGMQVSLF